MRIFVFVLAFFGGGAALASISISAGFSTGWVGAVSLIGWALMSRRHWAKLEKETGQEPAPPARALWIQCAGYGLLLGHLTVAILCVGNDLRLGNNNTLAIDSWTMVLAAIATNVIFRRERKFHDERDIAISAKGVKASYLALIFLSVLLALYLAFAPPNFRADLTDFVVGNILIALILASYLTQLFVRLHAYSQDAQVQLSDGTGE